MNIYWPKGVISNIELYRRCGVYPLFERIRKARWTLFGHVLRMDPVIPASAALSHAVNTMLLKGRVGRPSENLFNLLVSDLNRQGLSLGHPSELAELQIVAHNRRRWRIMCEMMPYDFYYID